MALYVYIRLILTAFQLIYLFYANKLRNHVHCMFIFTFFLLLSQAFQSHGLILRFKHIYLTLKYNTKMHYYSG